MLHENQGTRATIRSMQPHQTFDVAVIGSGVFGAWTAHQLQQSGAAVVLIDAYGPGNSRSSSGGETRIIRIGYGPDEIYSRTAARSLQLWQQFFERHEPSTTPRHDRLFQNTGVLWLAHADDPYCEATIRTLKLLGVRHKRFDRCELEILYPQLRFDGVEWAILELDSGALMARRAVKAVAAAAESRGVTVCQNAVLKPAGSGRINQLSTEDGKNVIADKFIFACGPWLPKLFPELLKDLIHITRQEVFFFGTPAGDDRLNYGCVPIWVDFTDLVYAIPNLDGRGLKIAIDSHGVEFDPDTGDRVVTTEGLAAVREYLRRRVPALETAPVTESRVCQYENTSNGDFLIDRHPDFENVWLVGGGSGHGFKHGPAVAEYVVSMISSGSTTEPRFSLSSKQKFQRREVF